MKKHFLLILVSFFFLGLASSGLDAQEVSYLAVDDASVFIIHGVPGLDIAEAAPYPVDIYINGTKRLSAVKYGKIKQVKIPFGTATIEFYKAGIGPEAGVSPILEGDFNFKKQENASIVSCLHPDGKTRLVKFTNDLSPAGDRSKCRVIIHNTSKEEKLGFWIYHKNNEHPWEPQFLNELIEPGDKMITEMAKKSLVDNKTWNWWLSVDSGWYWEESFPLYNKTFKIKAGKGILVYLVGSAEMKTFKVIKKVVPLK